MEQDENQRDGVNEIAETTTHLPVQNVEEVQDKGGWKALNGFSKLFFVLTIIGTAFAGVMVFLPIFLGLLGVFSVLIWLVFIIFVSIFTIGLIWTSDDFKSFNDGWMSLNDKLFHSSSAIADFTTMIIPSILISGGIIIGLSWLFTILGAVFDKIRHKKYKGRIIALSIITVIFIAFLILNIVIHNQEQS